MESGLGLTIRLKEAQLRDLKRFKMVKFKVREWLIC